VHPAPPDSSIGRVPRGRLVDRSEFLVQLATGRNVIDLGFVDTGRIDEKHARGEWLHERLARVTSSLVGIDVDRDGVDRARQLGLTAHVADIQRSDDVARLELQPAELVIAGELIEHLDRPGAFLDAIAPLVTDTGKLVITTPNPLALTNVLLGLVGREVQNAEHVGWHSWKTLDTLLDRHGWQIERVAFYMHPKYVAPRAGRIGGRLRVAAFNAYQVAAWALFELAPSLADGLIVVATRP
jgi:hypothetical protein